MTPLEPIQPSLESKPVEPPPPSLSSQPSAQAPKERIPHSPKKGLLLAGAALIIALGFLVFRHGGGETSDASRLPVVAVVKVSRGDLRQTLSITAEFHPYQQVALHAKIAGYLQSIPVDVGDHVREGQAIAQLDMPELKNDLAKAAASVRASEQEVVRAQANYDEAHVACQRLQDVAKQHPKLVAQQELDDVQAKDASAGGTLAVAKQHVEECQAEVDKTHSLLAYTSIVAPFDGVITKRYADPGALIQAGTSSSAQNPVVDIAEDKRLRLDFPVPESAVPLVKVGAPVRITISSIGATLEGKVSRYAGKVDRATRTMLTEVEIDNSDGRLTPGMYASVELVVRESKGAIAVPVQAIAVGEKPTVLVVGAGGAVEERAVKLGLQTPAKAEVTAGLEAGDMVIVGSRSGVQPGQKVTPKIVELTVTD